MNPSHLFRSLCVVFLFLLLAPRLKYCVEFRNENGLTMNEAQILLDLHNYYRARLAFGAIPGQPRASDMLALDWDVGIEREAQQFAALCSGPEVDTSIKDKGKAQNFAKNIQGRPNFMKEALREWVDSQWDKFDVTKDNFADGHEEFANVMTSYTMKLGCGYSRCSGHRYSRLVCRYFVSGHVHGVVPYSGETSCSKCPSNHPFCLEKALCVRREHCTGGNKCVCSINARRCRSNGGKFDDKKCHCQCKAGWQGANCDERCEDKINNCHSLQTKEQCMNPNSQLPLMLNNCKKYCGICNTWDNISFKRNGHTRGLSINIFRTADLVLSRGKKRTCKRYDHSDCPRIFEEAKVRAKDPEGNSVCSTDYELLDNCKEFCGICGACKDSRNDCPVYKRLNRCKDTDHYCRKTCGPC